MIVMKKYKLRNDCPKEEITEIIRKEKDHWKRLKWQVIYSLLADLRAGKLVAKQFGVSVQFIESAVKEYNELGMESFQNNNRGKHRKNYYLAKEEEALLLKEYSKPASKGEITTVKEIKEKIENKLKKEVAYSTVTRMVKSHGWRKVKPRPTHPKKDLEKQESFKKTSHLWLAKL